VSVVRDCVIWSFEHDAWWAPDRLGYELALEDAGRYTRDEAEAIVLDANLTGVVHEIALHETIAAQLEADLEALLAIDFARARRLGREAFLRLLVSAQRGHRQREEREHEPEQDDADPERRPAHGRRDDDAEREDEQDQR
jgi:hypothetical protein